MTKMKKYLTLLLGVSMIFSSVACQDFNEDSSSSIDSATAEMLANAPNYSDSNLQYEFYAYGGPTDGTWNEYDQSFTTGQDFRTVERYKEYKDAGLTIYLPHAAGYISASGASFEDSDCKMVMDRAYEAGIDKVWVTDYRMYSLVHKNSELLVGEGKQFETEADLDQHVRDCVEDYIDHPAFYGLQLADEPLYNHLENYGQMYRAIRRVYPDMPIQCALVCCTTSYNKTFYGDDLDTTGLTPIQQRDAAWRRYLEKFLDETGADILQYDQYPMFEQGIMASWMRGLQIAAEVARDRNVDLWIINQSYSMLTPNDKHRYLKEGDLRWLNNMVIGMGVKGVGYYTYWRKPDNNATEYNYDNASFVSQFGSKTEIYYWMQQIMKEEQALAPTILNFKYKESSLFSVPPPYKYGGLQYTGFVNGTLQKVKKVDVNKEAVLLTELYDKENDQYMYMIQNVIDPMYKGSPVYQTTTVTFSEEYDYAVVWKRGEQTLVKLDNHTYTIKQHPGDAVYVMPY